MGVPQMFVEKMWGLGIYLVIFLFMYYTCKLLSNKLRKFLKKSKE